MGSRASPRRRARWQGSCDCPWLASNAGGRGYSYSLSLCVSSPPLLPPTQPPQSVGFCISVLESGRSLRLGTWPPSFLFPQEAWLSDYAKTCLSHAKAPFPPLLLSGSSTHPDISGKQLHVLLIYVPILPHPHPSK